MLFLYNVGERGQLVIQCMYVGTVIVPGEKRAQRLCDRFYAAISVLFHREKGGDMMTFLFQEPAEAQKMALRSASRRGKSFISSICITFSLTVNTLHQRESALLRRWHFYSSSALVINSIILGVCI